MPSMPPVNSQNCSDQKPSAGQQPPFWSLKPWWCQPWSILSTGIVMVAGSWWWLERLWISIPLALAVSAWWVLFLVLVPSAYRSGQLQP